jgi:hypothetical protein
MCIHSREGAAELENLQNRSISSSRPHAEKSIRISRAGSLSLKATPVRECPVADGQDRGVMPCGGNLAANPNTIARSIPALLLAKGSGLPEAGGGDPKTATNPCTGIRTCSARTITS